MSANLAILGGGAFGWGLADAAARTGQKVLLWSRRPQRQATDSIAITQMLGDVAQAELLVFAIPSQHVTAVASELAKHLDGSHLLAHVSRGIVGEDLRSLTQVLREETPCRRIGALAGPVVARALSDGSPAAAIIGSRFPEVQKAVRQALSSPNFQVYATDDVQGVEFASTVVGLLSLAIGYGQHNGLRPSTLAMLVTRGLREAAQLGVRLGARAETFQGLAGMGDLLAAMAGDGRPELAAGRKLAGGVVEPKEGAEKGAHIEGILGARWIARYLDRINGEMPVLRLMNEVFEGRMGGSEFFTRLMTLDVDTE
ncbi:MAG: NAD(P)-binding domain-containing protein [Nannocystaceae bacterium]